MKKQIVITVEGGVIQDIDGIPSDVDIIVMDYDVEGADPEFADIRIDSEGEEYVHIEYGEPDEPVGGEKTE